MTVGTLRAQTAFAALTSLPCGIPGRAPAGSPLCDPAQAFPSARAAAPALEPAMAPPGRGF